MKIIFQKNSTKLHDHYQIFAEIIYFPTSLTVTGVFF